jgi:hypothetical protein
MYDQELIDTLKTHPNVETVWMNEDKNVWHFQEVDGFEPIPATEIVSAKKAKVIEPATEIVSAKKANK